DGSDRPLEAVSFSPAFERNPLVLSLEGGQMGCRPEMQLRVA
ncbi:MAG: hypothetical protein QOG47_468, partial [Mycobacterium sp.]|nr:hypothetical protein [Mycobacterium sp.]